MKSEAVSSVLLVVKTETWKSAMPSPLTSAWTRLKFRPSVVLRLDHAHLPDARESLAADEVELLISNTPGPLIGIDGSEVDLVAGNAPTSEVDYEPAEILYQVAMVEIAVGLRDLLEDEGVGPGAAAQGIAPAAARDVIAAAAAVDQVVAVVAEQAIGIGGALQVFDQEQLVALRVASNLRRPKI